jgi:hypothetical protein
MARLSKLRLDDLGIQVEQEKANERLATQLGRQVSSLTEAEKATAFRNEAMRQLVALSEDLAGKENVGAEAADRFATAITNAKNSIAELVAESPQVAAFFDGLTSLVTDMVAVITGDSELLFDAMKTLGRMAGDAFSIGVNEGIEAFIDKGNFFGRWVAGMFGGNADVGRANLAANREALAAIARAASASAAARGVGGGAAPSTIGRMPGGLGPVDVSGLPGITGPAAPGFSFAVDLQSAAQRRGRAAFLQRQADEAGGIRLAGGLGLTTGVGGVDEKVEEASSAFEDAGQIVAGTMFGMAQAAIHGTENVAAAVTGMITQILSSLPGVGGLLGTVIGGVGGLLTAAFTRRDPVPIRVAEYDSRALDQLERTQKPPNVTSILQLPDGTLLSIEQAERELSDRANRDETIRYGRNATPIFGGKR